MKREMLRKELIQSTIHQADIDSTLSIKFPIEQYTPILRQRYDISIEDIEQSNSAVSSETHRKHLEQDNRIKEEVEQSNMEQATVPKNRLVFLLLRDSHSFHFKESKQDSIHIAN